MGGICLILETETRITGVQAADEHETRRSEGTHDAQMGRSAATSGARWEGCVARVV